MKQDKIPEMADRPIVRGTAVGGQYISPSELFTTKAGREAIRNLIEAFESNKTVPPTSELPLSEIRPTKS